MMGELHCRWLDSVSFFSELQRRKVLGAALSYAVIAWLLLQVAAVLLPIFEAPDWALKSVPLLLLFGFPLVLAVSWFFQLRLRLEREAPEPTVAEVAAATTGTHALAAANSMLTSVAVLPFTNIGDDAEGEYFCDGLWLEVLHALVRVPDLHVPGPSSSSFFKGRALNSAAIGRELNVRTLLEGSVRKVGSSVRIAVQLVDTASGFHMWSETFNRQLGNLLQLQDEIATSVADKLQVELLGAPARKPASAQNTEAYNAYLRGRFFWNKRTREDYLRANLAYQEALTLDPEMSAAHAGIADVNTALAIEGEDTAWYRRARDAATTVLRLDPDNVDGLICRARLAMYCDWDWQAAQHHLERALELNPSNPSAQAVHARFLTFTGQLPLALSTQQLALRLDPLSLIHNRLTGLLLYFCGHHSQALNAIRKTIELDATFQSSHFNLGCIHLAQAHLDLALTAFRDEPHEPLSLTGQAITLHALGRLQDAQTTLDTLIREHSKGWGYQVGQIYAQRAQADLAFEWLHRALAERDAGMLSIGVDPLLAPLRDDPRLHTLLDATGLAAYYNTTQTGGVAPPG